MKAFVIGTLAASAAAGATYVMVANKAPSGDWSKEKSALEAAFQAEKDKLQQELAKERKRSGRVDTVEVEVSNALAPEEIIERLKGVHADGSRAKSLREVMFHLQSLVVHGESAVPAIRTYLALNEDIPYSFTENGRGGFGGRRGGNEAQPTAQAGQAQEQNNRQSRQQRGGPNAPGGPGGGDQNDFRQMFGQGSRSETNPTLDFALPPSLRIALIDVLRDIGGANAEAALAEVLKTSARGVEIALTYQHLEQMAPGRYTDVAVAAAKELIPNLPDIENPDRLDRNAKGYLYGILKRANDATFVATAKTLLVTDNGQIDNNALDYLNTVLKGQAVAILLEAYNDPRMANPWAKAPLTQQILAQVGANAQANKFFFDLVANPEENAMTKRMAIAGVAGVGGGRGPFGGGGGDNETASDPATLQARLQVLNQTGQSVDPNDQQTLAVLEFAQRNLNNQINGLPQEDIRTLFQQMGGGGGRGGGGFGGGGRQRGGNGGNGGGNF